MLKITTIPEYVHVDEQRTEDGHAATISTAEYILACGGNFGGSVDNYQTPVDSYVNNNYNPQQQPQQLEPTCLV